MLVTGGAGYVGSHACKALARAGYFPVVYDNLESGHAWAVKWGPLVRGDLLNLEKLNRTFRKYRPSAVLHFAGLINVGESVRQPRRYFRNNVGGTITLLEAMRENEVGKIIFSSTCAVYGTPKRVPIREDHPLRPINPYGVSKLEVEKLLSQGAKAWGLRSVSLRYFNAAGADPDGELGEAHDPETHLIPLVLKVAGTRRKLTINGANYRTPDGTCVRDYVHVSDLADAHLLALRYLRTNSGPTAVNVGTGKGFSVREVVEAARLETGQPIPVSVGPRRPGDAPTLVADSRRVRRTLGWRPRRLSIREMIATAWRWERKR